MSNNGDNKNPVIAGELNLIDEAPSEETPGSMPTVGAEYDSRPQEDAARRNIAYLLIGLLCGIILGIFILLLAKTIQLSDIKEFAVILGPVVALVSAATGFYYGTKK